MISKEKFIKIINFIKNKEENESALCSALEALCPGNYVDAFIYSEYASELVFMMEEAMQLSLNKRDILEWWIWELNYGKDCKAECCDLDLSTVEKLYNYLVSGDNDEK